MATVSHWLGVLTTDRSLLGLIVLALGILLARNANVTPTVTVERVAGGVMIVLGIVVLVTALFGIAL